ncbi:MAG TPA: 4-(cytidine 5'-diphospho)-2-C-methyl-D-erythritol kinase [Candidatus Hydrogenedentes bacterium]|nr:4-(cytidine 5'-diphospho)-2-C-methyl-D-erythritol kinase [Candidatus Hydrogenedentota bacterium]
MSTIMTYRSYAKLNLYLDVLNKRRDGFHNIETIFQTVSLADDITFEDQPNLITITCSSTELDTGEGNLVHRAAILLREHTGCKMGARIHLEKRIPIAAGLAGGSGNAAATLIALNKFWDLRLSDEHIRDLALKLGSDVPYCTIGGAAAATHRGEELIPLPPITPVWFVLVHPPIAVSAGHAYNHPLLEHSPQTPFAGRTPAFRKAIRTLAAGDIPCIIFNRMEQPVFHDYPQLAEIKQRLLELGCSAAAMSGSGPTIFGVCSERRIAARIAETLPEYRTSVVSPVPVGVERIA